jgi:hypothetical protein
MTITVQYGNATDVILGHANSPNWRLPELIVLGTRNRRGLDPAPVRDRLLTGVNVSARRGFSHAAT